MKSLPLVFHFLVPIDIYVFQFDEDYLYSKNTLFMKKMISHKYFWTKNQIKSKNITSSRQRTYSSLILSFSASK